MYGIQIDAQQAMCSIEKIIHSRIQRDKLYCSFVEFDYVYGFVF